MIKIRTIVRFDQFSNSFLLALFCDSLYLCICYNLKFVYTECKSKI